MEQIGLFRKIYYTDSIYKVHMDKLQNCSCNQFFFFSYFSLLVCVFCVLLLFCLLFLFCAFLFLYLQVYRTLLSGGNQIVLSKKISIYQLYHYQYINYININTAIHTGLLTSHTSIRNSRVSFVKVIQISKLGKQPFGCYEIPFKFQRF